ncbi:MAG: HEAT repeat domain-containing protein [Planctomycetota bacterium]|jgi:HEAT repeat protein
MRRAVFLAAAWLAVHCPVAFGQNLNTNEAKESEVRELVAIITAAKSDSDPRVKAALEKAGRVGPAMVRPLLGPTSRSQGYAGSAITNYIKTAAIPELIRALGDGADGERKAAAWALSQILYYHGCGKHDPGEIVAGLNRALKEDKLDYVRQFCASAAGKLKRSGAVPGLLAAAKSENHVVRAEAIAALASIAPKDDEKALECVIRAMEDSEPHVRGWAYQALAAMQGPKAAPRLVAEAKKKVIGKYYDGLVMALLATNAGEAYPVLLEELANTESYHRENIIGHLARTGDKSLAEALRPYLNDKERDVRAFAARAAGNFRDIEAAETLRKIVADKDEDHHVRHPAMEALAKIGDQEAVVVLAEWLTYQTPQDAAVAAAALAELDTPAAQKALYRALDNNVDAAENYWGRHSGGQKLAVFLEFYDDEPLKNGDLAARLLWRQLDDAGKELKLPNKEADRVAALKAVVDDPAHFGPPDPNIPRQEGELTDCTFYDGGFALAKFTVFKIIGGVPHGVRGHFVLYRLVGKTYQPIGKAAGWKGAGRR